MTPELDWDELRVFLALARARSARGAAALLKVSHSTVTRRVEALEARLGVRLFDRSRAVSRRSGWLSSQRFATCWRIAWGRRTTSGCGSPT
jgi:DNA-binding MarR family transcriptional regulator